MRKDISIYVIIILICFALANAYNKQILSQSCEEIKSIMDEKRRGKSVNGIINLGLFSNFIRVIIKTFI